MQRTITKIEQISPILPKYKRVAAYARVSSGKEAMLQSLSAQISYYSELIQKHCGWEYMGVYADEALSGTKDERAEFQRLLADCRAGHIDMIITKSISRFARNTVTMLETIRELKSIGVNVFFEKENIHSISGDGELMLTILASFAQEESLSVSENCKWRIRKKFQEGIPTGFTILGYKLEDNMLLVDKDEAVIIQEVFTCFLSGMGKIAIAKQLNEEGYKTKLFNNWDVCAVDYILRNEKYVGDMLLQKLFSSNHLEKQKRTNKGQLPMYYVKDSHEPIVDRDTFESVQRELHKRAEHYRPNKEPYKTYPFTGKIVCEQCGKNYRRKINNAGSKYAKPVWICSTYNELGKAACSSQQIPEDILFSLTAEVLSCSEFDEIIFKQRIKELRIPGSNKIIYILNNGNTLEKQWQHKSRSETWREKLCVNQEQ